MRFLTLFVLVLLMSSFDSGYINFGEYNGRVKEVKECTWSVVKVSSGELLLNEMYTMFVICYNEDGTLKSETNYSHDGKVQFVKLYKWENERLVEKKFLFEKLWEEPVLYEQGDFFLKYKRKDRVTGDFMEDEYYFDSDYQLVREVNRSDLFTHILLNRWDRDNLLTERLYYVNDRLIDHSRYSYEDNLLVREDILLEDDMEVNKFVTYSYELDSQNNWLKRFRYNQQGKIEFVTIREITYF